MREELLPCLHIGELFQHVQVPSPDVLMVDTEGYDFKLFEALDLCKVRPLFIEMEAKAFTRRQLGLVEAKLKAHGYRVFDANAARDTTHWRSKWTLLELMALRTGPVTTPEGCADPSWGGAQSSATTSAR